MILLLASLYAATAAVVSAAFLLDYEPVAWAASFRTVAIVLFAPIIAKYAIQMVLSFRYRRHQPSAGGEPRDLPSITVLIPAWNEEVGIAATIRSVLATRYPRLEIVVVNDGSTDGTDEVVRALLAEHEAAPRDGKPALRYRVQRNGGKARALNAGLALASGEILVTIDADSVMAPDFLREIARYLARHDVAAVAGNVVIGNRRRAIGLVQQLEYLYGFYFKRAEAVMGAVYIVGGAAAAYRRRIVQELGGFDEAIFTEDIELSTRLQRHGYRVGYAADAVVHTEGPSDLPGLCRQRLRWKHGRLLTFHKHRCLFASLEPGHSRILAWLIMPVALYAELLLLVEPVLLSAFLGYTLLTFDFAPLATFVALLALVIAVQVASDVRRREHLRLLAFAPVAWLLFYWLDAVEYQALTRSIGRLVTGRAVEWQRWRRDGVFGRPVREAAAEAG